MVLPALIAAGATLAGGILQNNSAKAQAQRQMDFQEEMSNTSYQRGMEDMRLAGLNPILAAKVGGASTPTGAAAPVNNVLGPAVSSAVQTQTAQITNENTQANTAKAVADTYKTVVDAEKVKAETERTSAETQHGLIQRLGGRNLTDLIGTMFNSIGDTSSIRKMGSEYNAGFRGSSAKSLPVDIPNNYRYTGYSGERAEFQKQFGRIDFPEGTLLPPRVR